jgi:predicted ribosomally synthesized peptide with SipW-like signal peptide
MKKRTKSLLAAFCTMALCGCLIAGSTYALFTDTANVDISVTSGKVDVEANVKDETLELYSAKAVTSENDHDLDNDTKDDLCLVDENGKHYTYQHQLDANNKETGSFVNGGTASINDGELDLVYITPGDKVEFDIDITNESNVNVWYRVNFSSTEKTADSNILMSGLNFTINEKGSNEVVTAAASDDETETTETTTQQSTTLNLDYSGYTTYITKWLSWTTADAKVKKVHAVVSLPISAGNVYQGKSIAIALKVEAVQSNANVGNNAPTVISSPVVNADGTASTINASVNVDSTVTLDSSKQLSVNVSEMSAEEIKNANIAVEIAENNSSVTYDIDVTGIGKGNTGYVSVVLTGIENDVQSVYHSGNAMTKLTGTQTPTSDGVAENNNGYYKYDSDAQSLTIYTTSFSPFTVEYKYAGGLGTEDSPYKVSSATQFSSAIENGGNVLLLQDLTLDSVTISGDTKIDLNNNTLTITHEESTIVENKNLTIINGNLKDNKIESETTGFLTVSGGGSILLDKVNLETNASALHPYGYATKVDVINSTIKAETYAVATNASTVENYNVEINIENSILSGLSAVFVNVPCSLKINKSNITGIMHGVVVRGGNAEITNSTISINYVDDDIDDMANYFNSRDWDGGNTLNLAALTFGNKAADGSYDYPTIVKIVSCNISTNDSRLPAIFGYSKYINKTYKDELNSATLYITNDCNIIGDQYYNGVKLEDISSDTSNITVTDWTDSEKNYSGKQYCLENLTEYDD